MTTPFNLFADLKTDDALEIEGKWVYPYGEKGDGTPGFRIARMGGNNEAYDRRYQAILKPHQRLIKAEAKDMGPNALKIIKDAMKRAFLDICLKNWTDVKNVKGEEIAFSTAAAGDLFKQVPQVWEDLRDLAMELRTFQKADMEDDAGNS